MVPPGRAVNDPNPNQQDEQQPARASFLGLPFELRLRIYEFLSPPHTSLSPPRDDTGTDSTPPSDGHRLAILHVSAQISAEAKPIIYGSIEIDAPMLKHVPDRAVGYIGRVFVRCWHDADASAWRCEPALTSPASSTAPWTLAGMWKYLGRTVPGLRQIRLHDDPRAKPRMIYFSWRVLQVTDGRDDGGDMVCSSNLQRVIIESRGDFNGSAIRTLATSEFESLKTEVARLGIGITVTEKLMPVAQLA